MAGLGGLLGGLLGGSRKSGGGTDIGSILGGLMGGSGGQSAMLKSMLPMVVGMLGGGGLSKILGGLRAYPNRPAYPTRPIRGASGRRAVFRTTSAPSRPSGHCHPRLDRLGQTFLPG
jgi:hypothetical protein